MRILDKGAVVQDLESLGMQPAEQERFAHAIARPHGAVLVTGPTGSGKSTTLYAALSVLNDGARSILTIEDPVESRIAGIKQMQIAPKAGVTFDVGLRSMLRADPDVIMVGEIRDRETAHIAVEAALTGHMVLSTLHTRDAPSALGRLIDMGIEPFLISSAVDCVVAQRLVRKLCPHCKRPATLPESVLAELGLARRQPFEAGRLLALLGLRLPRPRGHLRGDDRQRGDPHADPPARLRRRDRRDRRPPGDAPPARRRPREGPRRAHLRRGGRAHVHEPRLIPPARRCPALHWVVALRCGVGRELEAPGFAWPEGGSGRRVAQLAGYSSEIRSAPDGNASASNEYAW